MTTTVTWLLDLILLAFIAIIIIIYAKKGCTALIDLIAQPLTFIATLLLGPTVGEAVFGKFMLGRVTSIIKGALNGMIGEGQSALNMSELFEKMPESFTALLSRSGVSNSEFLALKEKFGGVTNATEELTQELASKLASPIAASLASVLGMILVFVAVFVILTVLKPILRGVLSLPLLKQADGILGIAVGVINAFVYTWIICFAISFILELGLAGSSGGILSALAENSFILKLFCNISLVDLVNVAK